MAYTVTTIFFQNKIYCADKRTVFYYTRISAENLGFQQIFHIVRVFFVSLFSHFFCQSLFSFSSIITSLILKAQLKDMVGIYSYISYCVINLNVFSINSQIVQVCSRYFTFLSGQSSYFLQGLCLNEYWKYKNT